MRLFVTILFAIASVHAQQQQIDPAYLRQYYHQLSQQNGGVGIGGQHQQQRAAPIFEPQEQQAPQQFVPQAQAPARNVRFIIKVNSFQKKIIINFFLVSKTCDASSSNLCARATTTTSS